MMSPNPLSENQQVGAGTRTHAAAAGGSPAADPTEASDGAPRVPSVTLPKGGGAIRGIGEKFAANPVTGTGSMTVPIATSPGRAGFGPQLSLSYDSGAGNGPFGFGWTLAVPAVTRKTDKGLPLYRDAEESDVFILSGAEDLVPNLESDGRRFQDETTAPGYSIHRYRPRIEGLFARLERWTRKLDGDVHWRSISRDNVLTLYGKDAGSRIADPGDPSRVFTWLICETRDATGNAVLYEYRPEDGAGVDLTRAHERNRGDRDDPRRTANRYLKRIRYGNRRPLLDDAGRRPRFLTDLPAEELQNTGWMFEAVLDYGEHDADAPTPDDAGPWTYRDDPFSAYRAGFEVRTGRLCQRVLMFHHFPGEPGVGADCLVRSTDFTFSHEQDPANARNPVYTFLRVVTQTGYRRHDGGYLKRSRPPVEFEYTQPVVQDTVQNVDAAGHEDLPIGLDGAAYQWTDLHGEGLPGILTEQAGAWFYERNLSPISEKSVEFASWERVATTPNVALAGGQAQFMDLAGDGQPDLVVLDGPIAGLYEHDGEEGWQPFRPFTSRLNRDSRDPNLKLVDLDGDGHADVLISEDDAFVWHASLAEDGFGPARRVHHALDEERGPRLVFADGTQSISLADLSGDGLTDVVRIRNGEVCYWPNLGFGRFGAKVTMDDAPRFDNPDQFDHRRIRLADIDGTGTTDIIYLHRDGVRLYFNQSGNGWSAPQPLRVFPRVDDLVAIAAVDLLGNGTACLVWSSSLPGDARRPMRYVDLMGGRKPHLLVKTVNNLGAETRVQYAPSTRSYLQDKRDGKPWVTRLPFPVHVVERVETLDRISGNRFVTRYAYHHGYFDGEEREFRGFGLVEQFDTETFAALTAEGTPPAATNIDAASHVPPVRTKTWFHTGIHLGRDRVSNVFAGLLNDQDKGEYYREPDLTDAQARERLLDDTVLPDGLTVEEEREACRALKGAMLHQEVYALDGTDKADIPYNVTEQNFTIERLQPLDDNQHGVFFMHPREAISHHYERNPADPRISHALTLEVDSYGNVLKSLVIGYGRRTASTEPALTADDKAKQTQLLMVYTENDLTIAIDDELQYPDDYRPPLPAETRTYELTGFKPGTNAARFSFEDWTRNGFALLTSAVEIPYEQSADNITQQERLVEHARALYRRDDLSGPLALGQVEPRALPFESYRLAFTAALAKQMFVESGKLTVAALNGVLLDEGNYVHSEGDANWWIPSGRMFYSPGSNDTAAQELAHARTHFFLPHRYRDPFHTDQLSTETVVTFDDYMLLVVETRDALDNTLGAQNDYRVLAPRLITDPNGNRSGAAFDALGMLVATAVQGKLDQPVGDVLPDFDPDLPLPVLQAFVADPPARAASLLGQATTHTVYDLDRYQRSGQPPIAATLARETHVFDPLPADGLKIQIAFSYSDGFGREIQQKIQAEPGTAPQRGPTVTLPSGDVQPGALVRDATGKPIPADTPQRWVGSGRTVFNNKGRPVRQYEPFFSSTQLYEEEQEVTDIGVSPILFYDPVERVVATLHPNHTYEKVVFDPWRQETWDVSDTIGVPEHHGDLPFDPKNDQNVGQYIGRLPDDEYLPTWYDLRTDAVKALEVWPDSIADNVKRRTAERSAADKASVHAGTPSTAHLDTLGRPFLTVALNRFERKKSDSTTEIIEDPPYHTRVELDIEGNQRAVRDAIVQNGDAQGRMVMRYDHDMLGNQIHQASMEAGERWTLNDIAGKPILAWDSRGCLWRFTYDELRRPVETLVTENSVERLDVRTVYGEGQGPANNHRLRVFQLFDGAGVVTNQAYDFKGNLLHSRRELLPDYTQAVDWQQNPDPNDGTFTSSTTYDALNRPTAITTPDDSIYHPAYNEANLLDAVAVNLRGAALPTAFVTNINYDTKGRRELIAYGNGAQTRYEYDPLTFRLKRMRTTRPVGLSGLSSQLFADPAVVQDLRYTYDPVGNITHIEDAALQTVFHNNEQVQPVCAYTYDAIYRLIKAEGREHIGQAAFDFDPPGGNRRDLPFVGLRAHPNDAQAMRNYTEAYAYDAAGNFQFVRHTTDGGGWTRVYEYDAASLIEAAKRSNRLTRTTVGDFVETYTYTDAEGNGADGCMTAINAMKMVWDSEDRLQQVDLGGGGTAYYVYDAAGQRVRKVIEAQNGTRKQERIYLGGFEVYREYNGNGAIVTLERETLHVVDNRQRIALVEARTDAPAPNPLIRYQFGNHLGSASLELNDAGQIISHEEYYPYGSTSYQAGRSAAEVSLKRYRYTGMERDEESGLNYHGARYYAPWLGRWTACDPAGLVDGPDLYVYSRSSPIASLDLTGLESKKSQYEAVNDIASNIQEQYKFFLGEAEQRGLDARKAGTEAGANLQKWIQNAPNVGPESVEYKFVEGYGPRIDVHLHKVNFSIELKSTIEAAKAKEYGQISHFREIARKKPGGIFAVITGEGVHELTDFGNELSPRQLERLKGLADFTRTVRVTSIDVDPWNSSKAARSGPFGDTANTGPKKTSHKMPETKMPSKVVKVGGMVLKVAPFAGVAAGLYSAERNLEQGNYREAALDLVGLIPVVGDAVDAVRLGAMGIEAAAEVFNEGVKTYQSLQEWNESGWYREGTPPTKSPDQLREELWERPNRLLNSLGL
jgi:RHS repeat-associated protein